MAFSLHPSWLLLLIVAALSGCSSIADARRLKTPETIRAQDSVLEIPAYGETVATGSVMGPAFDPANSNVYLPLTLRDTIEAALLDSSIVRVLEGRVNIASITPNDVLMAEQQIAAQQGRFQPRLSTSLDVNRIDQPPNAFFGPGIAANTRRDAASVYARVTQPLTTGGSVSLGLEPPLAYLYLPNGVDPGQFNPAISTEFVLRVNQPILKNAGRRIALAPIQIAQTQSNQTRWELEEVLNSQIRSVTEGYWRLYAAYLQLEAVRTILPVAEESVRIEELRRKADRSIPADVARAKFQRDGFRRTESILQGNLRKRVLQLRQLMGGEPSVNPLFLPSERPQENAPPENTLEIVQVAMGSRPTLNELREQLREKQLVLRVAENQVLPTLDLHGEYYVNGLAESLDASFRQAAGADYTDWNVGLSMDVPLGNKTARSRRRIAELDMARIHMRLTAMEKNVAFEVTELISDLQAQWQRLEIARRQTQETREWLRVSRIRYSQPQGSSTSQDWLLLALTDLQSAMRAYVDAVSDVAESLAEYNTLLAELNQAQGISVYEWRQGNAATTHGGHSGFLYQDYRSNPGPVVNRANISQSGAGLIVSPDGSIHSGAFNIGHSFLNNPTPTR